MPARKNVKTAVPKTTKPAVAKDRSPKKLPAKLAAKLPDSMITGKASPAKAADGDQPVFDYIASLPQPQRGIAEKVDALAAKTLPATAAVGEVGYVVLWRRRWLVLLLRWFCEPRQANVRERRDAHARTARNSAGDG